LPTVGWEVAAVDISGAAVWRRLGLQWLRKRFDGRAVDWRDLHLTSARGHDVHLATTTVAVHQLDAQGLAELLTRLDLTSATEIVKSRPGLLAGLSDDDPAGITTYSVLGACAEFAGIAAGFELFGVARYRSPRWGYRWW
jgi:hypothetical protein